MRGCHGERRGNRGTLVMGRAGLVAAPFVGSQQQVDPPGAGTIPLRPAPAMDVGLPSGLRVRIRHWPACLRIGKRAAARPRTPRTRKVQPVKFAIHREVGRSLPHAGPSRSEAARATSDTPRCIANQSRPGDVRSWLAQRPLRSTRVDGNEDSTRPAGHNHLLRHRAIGTAGGALIPSRDGPLVRTSGPHRRGDGSAHSAKAPGCCEFAARGARNDRGGPSNVAQEVKKRTVAMAGRHQRNAIGGWSGQAVRSAGMYRLRRAMRAQWRC